MSAVEDFSRYLDTRPGLCCCGHPQWVATGLHRHLPPLGDVRLHDFCCRQRQDRTGFGADTTSRRRIRRHLQRKTVASMSNERVVDAIWTELERQADRFGCVDRTTGLVDSGVDMDKVAEAAIAALGLTEEWTWSWPNGSAPGVPGYGFSVPTRAEAKAEADPYMSIVRRLVGPWQETP